MASTLEARASYLRDFAANVSHEFKTPLTAIRGAAELLSEHCDGMEAADRRRFLDDIIADTERLQFLVTRLLELARADTLEPADAQIRLLPALASIFERFGGETVAIQVSGDDGLAARISTDNLDMVVSNLIQNAIESGAHEISVSVARVGDRARIRFEDDGCGITPGNRAKIFDAFFTTRRETGGTGLGLTIVASTLAAHKGAIALGPPTARGAIFDVLLPIVGD